jgi:hypothetical protein
VCDTISALDVMIVYIYRSAENLRRTCNPISQEL